MFTGIIRHVGRVARVAQSSAGKRLTIDVGPLAQGFSPGASMAVDGVCLTAVTISGGQAAFDVVPETLARSTLGDLAAGDRVNLEPALAAGEALDGHIVQGHVDGVAEVARVDQGAGGWTVRFKVPEELTRQMVPKGSVALAGVSLTLVEVGAGEFSVAMIPTTLRQTTLYELRAGGRVNVELDILGKYVRRQLESLLGEQSGLTLDKLRRAGFVS